MPKDWETHQLHLRQGLKPHNQHLLCPLQAINNYHIKDYKCCFSIRLFWKVARGLHPRQGIIRLPIRTKTWLFKHPAVKALLFDTLVIYRWHGNCLKLHNHNIEGEAASRNLCLSLTYRSRWRSPREWTVCVPCWGRFPVSSCTG